MYLFANSAENTGQSGCPLPFMMIEQTLIQLRIQAYAASCFSADTQIIVHSDCLGVKGMV